MSRHLDPALASSLTSGVIYPVILCMLTFKSETVYCWSGVGTLMWNAQAFGGVGSLGKLGAIVEGIDVKADGTTVTLSGIDPSLKAECMTDIRIGAPAKIWFGNFMNGALIGAPYLVFSGQVDKPHFSIGGDEITCQLALENKLINHSRASNRKYTAADQRANGYPDDTGFNWVEMQNNIAIDWTP
jgi:hypothetical protein